jgi:hypothetical protein
MGIYLISFELATEMPVAIINRKNIADWCSNDCKILVTPSFFVVRPFLLISLLIYIFMVVCKKWPENSHALASNVQVGDNWSSTSML